MKLLSKLWRRVSPWGEHLFRRRFIDTLNLACNEEIVVNSKTHLFLNYSEHNKTRKTLHDKIVKININHFTKQKWIFDSQFFGDSKFDTNANAFLPNLTTECILPRQRFNTLLTFEFPPKNFLKYSVIWSFCFWISFKSLFCISGVVILYTWYYNRLFYFALFFLLVYFLAMCYCIVK